MTPDEALAECEVTVRRFDPDRYFAALFAPASRRQLLYALYAFNYEIERTADVAREPMMAEIRLQWWREAVECASRGHPPAHPAAIGLGEIFARVPPPLKWFENLIDAQAPSPDPSTELFALQGFAEATSAAVMRMAAFLLDPEAELRELARDAGIAYGLTRMLRAFPIFAARGRLSGLDAPRARQEVARISAAARTHLSNARRRKIPKRSLAAVLPASLVPSYLAKAGRVHHPLDGRVEISPLRRQLVLLRAAIFGRL